MVDEVACGNAAEVGCLQSPALQGEGKRFLLQAAFGAFPACLPEGRIGNDAVEIMPHRPRPLLLAGNAGIAVDDRRLGEPDHRIL